MQKNNNTLFVFLILLIIFAWGIQPLMMKKVYSKNISPSTNIFLSMIVNTICILIYATMNMDTIMQDLQNHLDKEAVILLIICALLLFFATLANNSILKNYDSILVTALTSIYPIITLLASSIFVYFHDASSKLTIRNSIGVVITTIGIILMS